jgi:hypothetical protein
MCLVFAWSSSYRLTYLLILLIIACYLLFISFSSCVFVTLNMVFLMWNYFSRPATSTPYVVVCRLPYDRFLLLFLKLSVAWMHASRHEPNQYPSCHGNSWAINLFFDDVSTCMIASQGRIHEKHLQLSSLFLCSHHFTSHSGRYLVM